MFALPVQGALAASRLCMGSAHPLAAAGAGAHAHDDRGGMGMEHHHHRATPADDHHAAAHAHHDAGPTHAVVGEHVDAPPMSVASHDDAVMSDHASGTCNLCAACCLTVAVAPPAPGLQLMAAGDGGYRTIVVPVPHNVADGLERPPRTI
jgi:hypothetical protein